MMNTLKIALYLILLCPDLIWAQNSNPCKGPASMNLFKVSYILNGKVKDLDTNFIINIYNRDSLIHVAHPYSQMIESNKPNDQYERLSSLIRIPILRLDSLSNLSAEIVIGEETIRWNANFWEYQDSLKFCDSHGLFIYKFSKHKKMPKPINGSYLGEFRKEIKTPKNEDFPFILVGWKLEEIEFEMDIIK